MSQFETGASGFPQGADDTEQSWFAWRAPEFDGPDTVPQRYLDEAEAELAARVAGHVAPEAGSVVAAFDVVEVDTALSAIQSEGFGHPTRTYTNGPGTGPAGTFAI